MVYAIIAIYIIGVIACYRYMKKNIRLNQPVDDWLDVIGVSFVSLCSWLPIIVWEIFEYVEKNDIGIKPPKWF